MRLGLLAESDSRQREHCPRKTGVPAGPGNNDPACGVIDQDKYVTEAVDLMLTKQVKRLPVIDAAGTTRGNHFTPGCISLHTAGVP